MALKNKPIKISIVISLGIIIGLVMVRDITLFCGVVGSAFIIILLVKNPELALAILFNGTIIYFYAVYKSGYETSRVLTGSFYAIIALAYSLGGILLMGKNGRKLKVNLIDILFICFFLWVFLSYLLFSTGNDSAYRKITYSPLLVIIPYFGVQLLFSEKRLNNLFRYCVLMAAILIIPSFYEFIFNPLFATSTRFSMYVFVEGGDNPILFGITFATMLLIIFIKYVELNEFNYKYSLLIIPSIFLMLSAGSRGVLVSFIFSLFFYIMFIKTSSFKIKLSSFIILILLLMGIYQFIPEKTSRFYSYTFTTEAQVEESSSVYKRKVMWKQAIKDYIESPILGLGTGNSLEGIGIPHNIILEIAAELGILGLIIFMVMCYITIKRGLSILKNDDLSEFNTLMKISLSLFIYSLVEAMFSGNITNQTQLFMSMGFITSLLKIKQYNDRFKMAIN